MKKNCLKLLILFVFFSSQMTINAQREGEVYFMFGDSVLYDNYRSNSAALLMIEKIAREIHQSINYLLQHLHHQKVKSYITYN